MLCVESESCLLIPGLDFTRPLTLRVECYENQHPRLPSIVFFVGVVIVIVTVRG